MPTKLPSLNPMVPPPTFQGGPRLPSADDMLARVLAAARAIGGSAEASISVRIMSSVDPDGDGVLPPVKGSCGFTVTLRRGALSVALDELPRVDVGS